MKMKHSFCLFFFFFLFPSFMVKGNIQKNNKIKNTVFYGKIPKNITKMVDKKCKEFKYQLLREIQEKIYEKRKKRKLQKIHQNKTHKGLLKHDKTLVTEEKKISNALYNKNQGTLGKISPWCPSDFVCNSPSSLGHSFNQQLKKSTSSTRKSTSLKDFKPCPVFITNDGILCVYIEGGGCNSPVKTAKHRKRKKTSKNPSKKTFFLQGPSKAINTSLENPLEEEKHPLSKGYYAPIGRPLVYKKRYTNKKLDGFTVNGLSEFIGQSQNCYDSSFKEIPVFYNTWRVVLYHNPKKNKNPQNSNKNTTKDQNSTLSNNLKEDAENILTDNTYSTVKNQTSDLDSAPVPIGQPQPNSSNVFYDAQTGVLMGGEPAAPLFNAQNLVVQDENGNLVVNKGGSSQPIVFPDLTKYLTNEADDLNDPQKLGYYLGRQPNPNRFSNPKASIYTVPRWPQDHYDNMVSAFFNQYVNKTIDIVH